MNTLPTNIETRINKRRLFMSLGMLNALLVVGTAGFWLLGNGRNLFESIYLTVVILTTVGMKEGGQHLSQIEQAWAMMLMLVGISAVLYAGGILVAFLIDGELQRLFGRRQLLNKIRQLKEHVIICGFGQMGQALCATMKTKGIGFVIIDNNPDLMEQADRLGYLYIQGDALSEETLRSAQIDTAQGLAACLDTDADNVLTTLSARGLNEALMIISRAEHQETESKLCRAGANRVICPAVLSAIRATNMLLQSAAEELLESVMSEHTDLTISRVELAQLPAAIGRSLKELSLPAETGIMVVAVVHPGQKRQFNPPPDLILAQDDQIIVIGPTSGVDKMIQLLGKPTTPNR